MFSSGPRPVSAFALSALLLSPLLLGSCSLADLRPEELRSASVAEDQDKGRQLLAAALRRRPWIRTGNVPGFRLQLRDVWESSLLRRFTPLTQNDEALDVRFRPDYMEMIFREGERKGETLGLRGSLPFEIENGQETPRDDSGLKVYLESLRLYLTLPARLLGKPTVLYAGEETLPSGGPVYRRVFVSDGAVAPDKATDQYLVYLYPGTGHIEWIAFTYRELLGSYSGALHYTDVRKTAFGFVPFSISVTEQAGDLAPVHRFLIESVQRDP